ncbi:hypothetical protein BVRB_2g024270 [Beta vulgaris subsp. vulgaris]|nr:hypothetical protein BVRB_2g024270 [Beta vulgaris subsp. vulgaris]
MYELVQTLPITATLQLALPTGGFEEEKKAKRRTIIQNPEFLFLFLGDNL